MKFEIFSILVSVAVAVAAPGAVNYAAPAVVAGVATYNAPAVAAVPAVASVPTAIVHAGANGRETYRAQDALGNYAAGYSVSDSLTGDFKAAHEQDVGGAKVGSFSQLDPNGYERRTDYVSDAFGTRQVITGSENGLYVSGPDHTIQPHGAPLVAATAPAAAVATYAAPAVAAAPVAHYAAPAVAAAPAIAAAPAVAHYAAPAVAAAPAVVAAPAVGPAVATASSASTVVSAPAIGYSGLGYGYGGLGLGYAGLGYGYGGLGYGGLGYGGLGYGYAHHKKYL